jgi:lipopolysaccharide heptosyltransferase I
LIKPSSPGDIIHALPVLHGLRRRFPEAHLAWLVARNFANLIEADPALDEVVGFDRKRFGRLGRSLRVTREFLAFIRGLAARQFDLVIDLQGLFRSGFLALASKAPVRIGFAAAREMAWMFYTDRLAPMDPETHAADRNYAVAGLLGFADLPMDFSITVTEDDRRRAAALLKQAGFLPGQRYMVLVPGARWQTKCWPVERYGRLAAEIKRRHYLDSILVGGASDVGPADQAAAASQGAARNLCGGTTLRQLAAFIERAAVVVTADSTPMHMAAALERPLLALFGPTNPRRTGPYGRLHDVLRLELRCSPCYLRKLSQCPYGQACLRDLSVEQVADAVAERLGAVTPPLSSGAPCRD